MRKTPRFMLPYEPQYTGHRKIEQMPKEIEEWRRRAREVTSPSIAPEPAREDEKIE